MTMKALHILLVAVVALSTTIQNVSPKSDRWPPRRRWERDEKRNEPSDSNNLTPTPSLLMMEGNVKGILDLPELSKEEAILFETMRTISPEDALFKHVFKEPRKKLGIRDKRANSKTKKIENGQSGVNDIIQDFYLKGGRNKDKELEIEYEPVVKKRNSGEESYPNSGLPNGNLSAYIRKRFSNEFTPQSINESRERRNIFFPNQETRDGYEDDYSSPDYIRIGDVEDSGKLSVKSEEGDTPISLAKRNSRSHLKFTTYDAGMENEGDTMSNLPRPQVKGNHESERLREKRLDKKTFTQFVTTMKSFSKFVTAIPPTVPSFGKIVKNIGKNLEANVTKKEFSSEIKNVMKSTEKYALPNILKESQSSVHGLKKIVKNLEKNLTKKVSNNELAKDLADALTLTGKISTQGPTVTNQLSRPTVPTSLPSPTSSYITTVLPKRATTFLVPTTESPDKIGEILTILRNIRKKWDKNHRRRNRNKLKWKKNRPGFKWYKKPKGQNRHRMHNKGKGLHRHRIDTKWNKKGTMHHRPRTHLNHTRLRFLRPVRYRMRLKYNTTSNNVKQRKPVARNQWTSWSSWSVCSATCGSLGTKTRLRFCVVTPCVGGDRELQRCDTHQPCPTTKPPLGDWLEWGGWTTCSVTCGLGTEHQRRRCTTSRCHGHNTKSRNCIRETCNPLGTDEAQLIVPGKTSRLRCRYNHASPVKKIYWVSPKGFNIYKSEANPRIVVDGDFLYIGRPTTADRGIYRCVIVRHNGKIDTSDSPLEPRSCQNHDTCLNGGVCVDYKNHWGYRCICQSNYSGKHCEHSDNTVPLLVLLSALFVAIGILLVMALRSACKDTGDDFKVKFRLPKLKRPKIPSITSCTDRGEKYDGDEEEEPLLKTEEPKEKEAGGTMDQSSNMYIIPEHPGRYAEPIYENIENIVEPESVHNGPLLIRQNAFKYINKDSVSKLRSASTPNRMKPLVIPPPRHFSVTTHERYRDRSPLSRNNKIGTNGGDVSDASSGGEKMYNPMEVVEKGVAFSRVGNASEDKAKDRVGVGGSWDLLPDISDLPAPKTHVYSDRLMIDVEPAGEETYMEMGRLPVQEDSDTPEKTTRARNDKTKSTPVPGNWFSRNMKGIMKGIAPKKKKPASSEGENEKDKIGVENDESRKRSMLEVAGLLAPGERASSVNKGNNAGINEPHTVSTSSWAPYNYQELPKVSSERPIFESRLNFSPKTSKETAALDVFIGDQHEVELEGSAAVYQNETLPGDYSSVLSPEYASAEEELYNGNPYAKWSPGGKIPEGPANMPPPALHELHKELIHKGLSPERPQRPLAVRLFSSDDNINNANNVENDPGDEEDQIEETNENKEITVKTEISEANRVIAEIHTTCIKDGDVREKPASSNTCSQEKNLITFDELKNKSQN